MLRLLISSVFAESEFWRGRFQLALLSDLGSHQPCIRTTGAGSPRRVTPAWLPAESGPIIEATVRRVLRAGHDAPRQGPSKVLKYNVAGMDTVQHS